MRPITHLVVHCSASPNGAAVTAQHIDQWHRARGWNGIGYHYVIEVDGAVVTGRPEAQIGAHTYGHNATSLGICMVGTDRFSLTQWEALASVVRNLRARYPTAGVVGHRDLSPDVDGDGVVERWEWLKTCPGFEVNEWLRGDMAPLVAHLEGADAAIAHAG